ncbi:MAG: hypothetical protein DI629_18070 [Mesorhizobium amorphae]|nr:MAG: hypothetical protein DI629_18070 [Mesorhizobium amorphae]
MNALAWPLLGVIAGAAVALQAPINARLAQGLGLPVAAAAVSFMVGGAILTIVALSLARAQGIALDWRAPAPWTFVAGGVLGGFFVTSTILIAPRIGAAALMASLVTGQLLAGLLADRIGFLGLAVRELTLGRIAGACLLLAGALMIRFT